jgi:hypothetical protein
MSLSENIYPIEYPAIPTAGIYYFNTDKGLRYEVRFGRMENNPLHATIVFGVVNDEFEEEYVTTNKGDVFKVMNTISEIIRDFIKLHPRINIYEFNAISRDEEEENSGKANARMKLYQRFLPRIFNPDEWTFEIKGNYAKVKLKK